MGLFSLKLIAGTVATHFASLNTNYSLATVGKIQSGSAVTKLKSFVIKSLRIFIVFNRLPTAAIPDVSLFLNVVQDAFIISLVSFASSISIADLYARKHKYKINANKVNLHHPKW